MEIHIDKLKTTVLQLNHCIEEYEEICLNPENPQTGSFLPYAVIIGGIVVAIGLYMFTKKNKIYHI